MPIKIKRNVEDSDTGGFSSKDLIEFAAKFKAHELDDYLKAPKRFYRQKKQDSDLLSNEVQLGAVPARLVQGEISRWDHGG